MTRAANEGFTRQDGEDILHDAVVHILEHDVSNPDLYWKSIEYSVGKHRRERSRQRKRQVSLV